MKNPFQKKVDIIGVNQSTLTDWGNRFIEIGATPSMLVGVKHDGSFVMRVREDANPAEILALMQQAMKMLEARIKTGTPNLNYGRSL